jgi:hypothetical protein
MIILKVIVFVLLLAPAVMLAWEWKRRHHADHRKN